MRLGFGYGRRKFAVAPLESDYLHGIELDVALSDYTLDMLEPVDREAQVIELPMLTADQRAQILAEYNIP